MDLFQYNYKVKLFSCFPKLLRNLIYQSFFLGGGGGRELVLVSGYFWLFFHFANIISHKKVGNVQTMNYCVVFGFMSI